MGPISIKVQSECFATPEAVSLSSQAKKATNSDFGETRHLAFGDSALANVFQQWLMAPSFLGLGQLFADALATVNVSANPSSISFGDVNLYSSATNYFYLNNNGDCEASVSFSSPYGFSVSPGSTTVAKNSSASIAVTFSPSSEQYYSGSVSGTHGISIYVSGEGVDPYAD